LNHRDIWQAKSQGENQVRQTIEHWLLTGQEAERLNYQHSFFVILGGLQKTLVPEIRPVWDKIGEPLLSWFKTARMTFAQAKLQQNVHLTPPGLPYLPFFVCNLGDLCLKENNLLNVKNILVVGNRLRLFHSFRYQTIGPTSNPSIQHWLNQATDV